MLLVWSEMRAVEYVLTISLYMLLELLLGRMLEPADHIGFLIWSCSPKSTSPMMLRVFSVWPVVLVLIIVVGFHLEWRELAAAL